MKKQKHVLAIIVIIAAVVGFSFYALRSAQRIAGGKGGTPGVAGANVGSTTTGIHGMPGGSAAGGAVEATSVRVATAAVKTLKPYIDESGDVEANVNVAVYPDIGGRLVNFTVALGDSVVKGQTIARVDPSKPGSNYAVSDVVAPISGTVTGIVAEQGETVTTATSLATVGIIDDLKIVVNLPERDSAKAARGMTAVVTFEALPDESFTATVSRVSPVLNATSRTREIELVFPRHDGRISAGMYPKVRLYTTPITGKVVIPAAAVIMRNGENCVFIATDKAGGTVAEQRAVKTGTTVDSDVVVTDGVAAGEQVIYEGQSGLSNGASVSVLASGAGK